jgi:hypothetical protein
MIFRILIFKNNEWQELDLPSDFNLSLILNSGFLGKKQSGSFSFTSTLPPTATNCAILEYADNPQIVTNRNIQFPAKLLYGSTEFYAWYFVLREARHNGYKYDLVQTPGNQPRNFFEKKLWQLDFGKLDLKHTTSTAPIFVKNLYDDSKLFRYFNSPEPFLFEIYINGNLTAHPPMSGIYKDKAWYWDKTNDPESRFAQATVDTNYNIVLHIPKKGVGSLNIYQLSPDFPVNFVEFRIYQYTMQRIKFNDIFAVAKGILIAQYNLQKPKYQDVTAAINNLAQHQEDYPFKFLTYNNDSFYPSDNNQYEGIVNQYLAPADNNGLMNFLKTNKGLDFSTYPISPCFSLIFILTKIAEMMGFTLVADIFQDKAIAGDEYLGDLHLINNVDFAAQLPDTTFPFNIYGTTMTYANFMPDMTVKEFIDAIRTTFCLAFEYDYANDVMTVSKCKDTLTSNEVIDISDKLTRFPTADILDKTHYQLSFKNAEANVIAQADYPSEESIADDGKDYTKIEAGFCPVLNNFDLDPFLATDNNPFVPTINDAARTVIYLDQKNNHPTPKITFYLGQGNNGITWVGKSNNNNGKICLSWQDQDKLKGLLTFYQEYLDFLNKTMPWNADIWLSELELANFRFAQKYYAYGTTFIVESISPKIPIKNSSKIKLLSA